MLELLMEAKVLEALIAVLPHSEAVVQKAALNLLLELLQDNPPALLALVRAGGVRVLCTVLTEEQPTAVSQEGESKKKPVAGSDARSSSRKLSVNSQMQALQLMDTLASNSAYRGVMAKSGCIECLLRVAQNPDQGDGTAESAARALLKLTTSVGEKGTSGRDVMLRLSRDAWLPGHESGKELAKHAGASAGDKKKYGIDVISLLLKECLSPQLEPIRTNAAMVLSLLARQASKRTAGAKGPAHEAAFLKRAMSAGVLEMLAAIVSVGHEEEDLDHLNGTTGASAPWASQASSISSTLLRASIEAVANISELLEYHPHIAATSISESAMVYCERFGRDELEPEIGAAAVVLLCRLAVNNHGIASPALHRVGIVVLLGASMLEYTRYDIGHLFCVWAHRDNEARATLMDEEHHAQSVDLMVHFAQNASSEAALNDAARGFQALLGEPAMLPALIAGGIASGLLVCAHSTDAELVLRSINLMKILAADKVHHARLETDGVVKFLRHLAGGTHDAALLEAATGVLGQMGQAMDNVLEGGTLVMAYPKYWDPFPEGQSYMEVELEPQSDEFRNASNWLNKTMKTHKSGYGCIAGTDEDAKGFAVGKVMRIQNKDLWRDYFFKKASINDKYNGKLETFEFSKHMARHPSQMQQLDQKSNEYFLWHGTSWDTTNIVKKLGFDYRLSSVFGMFGGGCYFAEDSSKSNQYIPCPQCGGGAIFCRDECKCHDPGFYPIMICRVLLGDSHLCMEYDSKKYRGEDARRPVRRPPNKPDSMDCYDAVVGETGAYGAKAKHQRPLKFREYITYELNQAYPEYLIYFKRVADKQPHLPTSSVLGIPAVHSGSNPCC